MRLSSPTLQLIALGLWCVCALDAPSALAGDPPAKPTASLSLHERIDRLIETGSSGKFAAPATDSEFVRRAYLDFVGMIPTAAEARDFIDDPSPYKRDRLIDKLLASPEYARRMAIAFDVMLMERRHTKNVRKEQWSTYLVESFSENKPYDQLVREILSADGKEPAESGEARFILERGGEPHTLTRDVGRFFLGRDMQCAQCHDHPLVDDFKQAHYQGLLAFFNRLYALQPEGDAISLGEKAEGEVEFKSVFKRKVLHKTGPKILDCAGTPEPAIAKGDEYWLAPADGKPAIPKHSRRALLAGAITSKENKAFRRTAANRIWALMLGRGIVHPVDWDHPDNPPSHPELLDMLGDEFATSGFDVKNLMREIALSQTYQRSSEPPPGVSEGEIGPETFAVAALEPLTPEQLCWSLMQAAGIVEAKKSEIHKRLFDADPKFAAIASANPKLARMAELRQEDLVYRELGGNAQAFVQVFAPAAGVAQDKAEATVHQALFLANGFAVQGWLAPNGSNATSKVATAADPGQAAEEVYLALLSRRPTAEERAEVSKLLAEAKDKPKAAHELAWAIATSVEFRFNH